MKKILERTTTKLYADYDKKIVLGQMAGDVLFEDYKEMLIGGAKMAEEGKINNIVIDRRNILKQDAECRLWVKNYYIKKHVKPLVPKIKKVAIVESNSIVGKIYGKTIFTTLGLIYPNLTIKSFAEVKQALSWVSEEEEKSVIIDDLINDEKNFFSEIIDKEKELHKEEQHKQELVTVAAHYETTKNQISESSLITKLFRYFFPD